MSALATAPARFFVVAAAISTILHTCRDIFIVKYHRVERGRHFHWVYLCINITIFNSANRLSHSCSLFVSFARIIFIDAYKKPLNSAMKILDNFRSFF